MLGCLSALAAACGGSSPAPMNAPAEMTGLDGATAVDTTSPDGMVAASGSSSGNTADSGPVTSAPDAPAQGGSADATVPPDKDVSTAPPVVDAGGSDDASMAPPFVDAGAGDESPPIPQDSSPPQVSYPYIFSCFDDDNTHKSDLMIYTSNDALNWTLLSDTGYLGPTGFMRDPSIMRHTDGKYYVAYTTPPDLSCCGPEQSFSIGSSSDLKNWTTIATVPCGRAGTTHTWSPEWFVDTDGSVHITATLDDAIYHYEPTDATLTKWSGPTAMGVTGTIDAQVIKVGSTYHMLLSNQRQIASSFAGPWTRDDTFVPPTCKEGPAIVHVTGDTWRYYCDNGGTTHESSSLTTDLFKTWGPLATLPVVGDAMSQGTVIRGDTGHPF